MGMGQNLTIQQTQQNLCIFRIYSIYIYIYIQYIHIILYILNLVSSTQNACDSYPRPMSVPRFRFAQDMVSIDQSDPEKIEEGIYGIGGFLSVSSRRMGEWMGWIS